MQVLTMFSVSRPSGRLFAIVPGAPDEALRRLQADDALWQSPRVVRHWHHVVDTGRARVRLRDRVMVWLGGDWEA
jgi:hypothetical protein